MVKELPALVEMHMFVRARGIALAWEMRKPFKRRPFGDSSVAMFHASEVISDKDPASLTIDSDAVFSTLGIFRGCSCEAEVDG